MGHLYGRGTAFAVTWQVMWKSVETPRNHGRSLAAGEERRHEEQRIRRGRQGWDCGVSDASLTNLDLFSLGKRDVAELMAVW